MSLTALQCEGCGGALAFDPGAAAPACLFCGGELRLTGEAPPAEVAGDCMPFRVDEQAALEAFRRFARRSLWYPEALRRARPQPRPLYLPAWAWSAQVETHWTALVPRDGGSVPLAGSKTRELRGVLVPASFALTRAELLELAPFRLDTPDAGGQAEVPRETSVLAGASVAREGARALDDLHANLLRDELSATWLRTASVLASAARRPLYLPVWVLAWQDGDVRRRALVNGQTGVVVGATPRSVMKLSLAVAALLGLGTSLLLVLFASLVYLALRS